MVDFYPGAIQMPVPHQNTFWNANPSYAIVIHGTAGWQGASAQDIANMFINAADGRSSHFIVGRDGTVVQTVSLVDGAGANCCLSAGHDTFWDIGVANLNTVTISIEHVKWTTDNSDGLTPAQEQSSFKLVKWICDQKSISANHIKSHGSLDPINRSDCPGNYPWQDLFTYLSNGGQHVGVPSNWRDDGTTLTAPNNIPVVKGFRDFVINNPWDGGNWPVEAEHGANPLEISNTSLGSGTKQRFRMTTLEWSSSRGVFVAWSGPELLALEQKVQQLNQQLASTQNANVEQLQAQLDAANKQLSAKNTTLAQIATEATNASK